MGRAQLGRAHMSRVAATLVAMAVLTVGSVGGLRGLLPALPPAPGLARAAPPVGKPLPASKAPAPGMLGRLEAARCETDRVLRLTHPPMAGEDVWELNVRLKQLGYLNVPKPGNVFDFATDQALRRFQRDHGLKPDGAVRESIWRALAGPEEPRPTAALPPPKPPLHLVIDVDRRILTLYSQGRPYRSYPVAIGKERTPSPIGEWRVVHKDSNWGGGFGTRWLGLDVPWGIYGIHGTNKPWSIGTAASGGCFRMFNTNVEELWAWVPLGTPVTVTGRRIPVEYPRTLRQGDIGQDVAYLQLYLREAGFPVPRADGRFGAGTAASVRELQRFYGLPVTGQASWDVLGILGMY
ncbi:MAG: peptidoglycan-binding protein [Firmicutes bacterium]|nr:peptidoglycan-binding protein [Bacillota bacterium]